MTRRKESVCKHPRSHRWRDPQTGETICLNPVCGEVLAGDTIQTVSDAAKFGRAPTNRIVFNGNLGSTSKRPGQNGPEPSHLHVLTELYGNRDGSKLKAEMITESCRNCKHENHLKIFGDTVLCEKCQAELGFFSFRYLPNGGNNAIRFWSDLRMLEAWDGPDDDPVLKIGRELLSKKLIGRVSDEDAHWLARKCIIGLRELSRVTRREIERVVDSILEGEKAIA